MFVLSQMGTGTTFTLGRPDDGPGSNPPPHSPAAVGLHGPVGPLTGFALEWNDAAAKRRKRQARLNAVETAVGTNSERNEKKFEFKIGIDIYAGSHDLVGNVEDSLL